MQVESNAATDGETNRRAIERLGEAILENQRVVMIWGAGASVECGIPTGKHIGRWIMYGLEPNINADEVKSALGNNYDAFASKLSYELRPPPQIEGSTVAQRAGIGYAPLSFGELLDAYEQIYDEESLYALLDGYIPSKLSQNPPPYLPTYAHESCAHLVNSGFLKYFISMNFDEILESTLENELGSSGVQVLVSKSEFARLNNLEVNNWDAEFEESQPRCFVLKPHGTISRKPTLRYLPKQVKRFDKEKKPVLATLLENSVVVILGLDTYNDDISLLFGQTSTGDIVVVSSNADESRDRLPPDSVTREVLPYNGLVSDFFKELTDELYSKKNWNEVGKYRLKPTRHSIRGHFFKFFSEELMLALQKIVNDDTNRLKEGRQATRSYRELTRSYEKLGRSWIDMRAYELELLLYLFKARGLFIDLVTADCPRIYQGVKKCFAWRSKNELQETGLRPSTVLYSMLNELIKYTAVTDRNNEKVFKAFWCTLMMSATDDENIQITNYQNVKSLEQRLDAACEHVAQLYCSYLTELINNTRDNELITALLRAENAKARLNELENGLGADFKSLYSGFDVDVEDRDISTRMHFEFPEVIDSRTNLVDKSEELFKASKWNKLRLTTISGEWLAKMKVPPRKNCRIEVMSNLDLLEAGVQKWDSAAKYSFHYLEMAKSIANFLCSFNEHLDEWQGTTVEWRILKGLEHHARILSDELTPNDYLEAIYFQRKGKNTTISPVFLGYKNDVQELSDYFDVAFDKLNKIPTEDSAEGRLLIVHVDTPHVRIEMPKKDTCATVKNLRELLEPLCKSLCENVKFTDLENTTT